MTCDLNQLYKTYIKVVTIVIQIVNVAILNKECYLNLVNCNEWNLILACSLRWVRKNKNNFYKKNFRVGVIKIFFYNNMRIGVIRIIFVRTI